MRTFKSITVIAFLFATALNFAHTTPSVLSVKNNGMNVEAEVDNKPFFKKTKNKLYMNFFNQDMGDVQIRVIDGDNRILFKETLRDMLVVEKAFNFSSALKDSYKVIIKDGNETYYEYYVVK